MTIVKASDNLTTKDIYLLTMNPNTQKMKDAKGERIELNSLATSNGKTYATNSPTFIDDFMSMMELFTNAGETVPAITVSSGTSKAGREYISCVYCD